MNNLMKYGVAGIVIALIFIACFIFSNESTEDEASNNLSTNQFGSKQCEEKIIETKCSEPEYIQQKFFSGGSIIYGVYNITLEDVGLECSNCDLYTNLKITAKNKTFERDSILPGEIEIFFNELVVFNIEAKGSEYNSNTGAFSGSAILKIYNPETIKVKDYVFHYKLIPGNITKVGDYYINIPVGQCQFDNYPKGCVISVTDKYGIQESNFIEQDNFFQSQNKMFFIGLKRSYYNNTIISAISFTNTVFAEYLNKDCTAKWKLLEKCEFSCSEGKCIENS